MTWINTCNDMTHWEGSSPSNLTYIIQYHPGSHCASHLCLALTCPLTRSGRLPAPHRAEPRRCACSAPGFDARIWRHIFPSIIEGICKLPGLPGCLLFLLHSIFNLFISFHSPLSWVSWLLCLLMPKWGWYGLAEYFVLCIVCSPCSCHAKQSGRQVARWVDPTEHSTLTRGKQPKNTLWDPLPAICGLQCLQKNTSMDKNKKSKWRNDWQKHTNKITGSFAQNLL